MAIHLILSWALTFFISAIILFERKVVKTKLFEYAFIANVRQFHSIHTSHAETNR